MKCPPLVPLSEYLTPVANWYNSFIFQSGRKLDSEAVSHSPDCRTDKVMSTSTQQGSYSV